MARKPRKTKTLKSTLPPHMSWNHLGMAEGYIIVADAKGGIWAINPGRKKRVELIGRIS